jgi:hypothetical protein
MIYNFKHKKIKFQLGMLPIPNLTKAQAQFQSIVCFTMSEGENGTWNRDLSASIKSATISKIQKNCEQDTRPISKCRQLIRCASISDGFRQILVLFNQSSVY